MRAGFKAVLTAALLVGALLCGAPGQAQVGAANVTLYEGQPLAEAGVVLGGWGNGTAEADSDIKAGGDVSIKISTNGYYAGGRIMFTQPRDITAQKNDPYGYLEFISRFLPASGDAAGGGGGLGPAGPDGSGGDLFGGQGAIITPATRRLKVVLICEEGTFTATNFPLSLTPAREEGWFSMAIPFASFQGLQDGDGPARTAKVREIRLFGDNKDTFWVAEIRTTTNTEEITVEPLEALEVSKNEPVEFAAVASGGISPLRYVWDFDASDGFQEDAVGQVVYHIFRKESRPRPGSPGDLQPYVVTLRVEDVAGAKKPVERTVDVVVNP